MRVDYDILLGADFPSNSLVSSHGSNNQNKFLLCIVPKGPMFGTMTMDNFVKINKILDQACKDVLKELGYERLS